MDRKANPGFALSSTNGLCVRIIIIIIIIIIEFL